MIARGEGYLLNTASAAGLLTQIGSLSYSITKHAAVSLAEWLSITHHHQGIRVSVLCPQAVETNIVANSPDRFGRHNDEGTELGSGVAGADGVKSPPTSPRRVSRQSGPRSSMFSPMKRFRSTWSARRPMSTAGSPECAASKMFCTPADHCPATPSPRRCERTSARSRCIGFCRRKWSAEVVGGSGRVVGGRDCQRSVAVHLSWSRYVWRATDAPRPRPLHRDLGRRCELINRAIG